MEWDGMQSTVLNRLQTPSQPDPVQRPYSGIAAVRPYKTEKKKHYLEVCISVSTYEQSLF